MEFYEPKSDPIGKYFIERIKIISMTEKYQELQKTRLTTTEAKLKRFDKKRGTVDSRYDI